MNQKVPDFLNSGNNKGIIFREAAKLFAEKGYNGVSMREISERTGLSKPTIYYYFGNKEGIYTELVAASLNYNIQQFMDLMSREMSTKEKLIELVKIRFRQVLEYPELAKFFTTLMIGMENLPFLNDLMKEAVDRRRMLADLIKEGVEKGEFGPTANSELATEVLVGIIMHFILRQINTPEQILSDDLAEKIVEILFKGWNE